jgi:hypothetical protein
MSDYVVLLHQDESRAAQSTETERADLHHQHVAFHTKHGAAIKAGDALQPTPTSRVLRDELVTDGPFVETKEALGGFYLIEAADLDEAIAIASDIPTPNGGLEIRPVLVLS